jgi:hypothetical protein
MRDLLAGFYGAVDLRLASELLSARTDFSILVFRMLI